MTKRYLKAERCSCGAIDRYNESQYGHSRYERRCPVCQRVVMYHEPAKKDYVKELLDAVGITGAPIEVKPDAETVERELGFVPSLQLIEHFFSYTFPEFSVEDEGLSYRVFDIGISEVPLRQMKERLCEGKSFIIGKAIRGEEEAEICWDEGGAQMYMKQGTEVVRSGCGIRAFYEDIERLKENESTNRKRVDRE